MKGLFLFFLGQQEEGSKLTKEVIFNITKSLFQLGFNEKFQKRN